MPPAVSTPVGVSIQTSLGGRFNLLEPSPEDVDIRFIATSLSRLPRFLGHTREGQPAYSVAQHSVVVSLACAPEDALWGLLHDASEALTGDLPSPIKHMPEMQAFRDLDRRIMGAICDRFSLPRAMPASVRHADRVAFATEVRDLMAEDDGLWSPWTGDIEPLPEPIVCLTPGVAREWFLSRFHQLTGGSLG